jgi:hypothetical protein
VRWAAVEAAHGIGRGPSRLPGGRRADRWTGPLIATALLVAYHNNYVPVGIFIMLAAVLSLIAIAFAEERRGHDLDT